MIDAFILPRMSPGKTPIKLMWVNKKPKKKLKVFVCLTSDNLSS